MRIVIGRAVRGAMAVLTAFTLVACVAGVAAAAPPDWRAYELVSPPDKNGGDIMAYSARTRASADGDAIGYASLAGFGDVRGTGAPVDYLAERTDQGWITHAITPAVAGNTLKSFAAGADVFYDGAFSPDFRRGILMSPRPITNASSVKDVVNLYRRDDLRTAGAGGYELVTACPLCDATRTPLQPLPGAPGTAAGFLPQFASASPDLEHVTFESTLNLTPDAPAQPGLCGSDSPFFPPPSPVFCRPRLYEWDHGTVRLAGVLPDGTPADDSFAGSGARRGHLTPHTVSDGSDGHSRIFFTQPTNAAGLTVSQLDPNDQIGQLGLALQGSAGNVFMRIDHAQTIQLNTSERTSPDAFAPAQYLDASANGERIFFMTTQALTEDAEVGTDNKIYMYDASKPDADPHNLTLLTTDGEPADGADARGLVGVSDDGRYAYMVITGQIVRGDPTDQTRIFLWHDGVISDIGAITAGSALTELIEGVPSSYSVFLRQARVTPDGRHLEFTTLDGSDLGGYDQSACVSDVGFGCREVYVYSADTNRVECASCNPSGAPATVMASVAADEIHGSAHVTGHENRGITDDGALVFFSTAEALVPQDTNGRSDAYEYNVRTRRVSLLSTGKDSSDSWFVDASASGNDVFVVTRQRLVGWDRDGSYDLYDVRVGGGFPEPPPTPIACLPGTCQGQVSAPPAAAASSSESFQGSGDLRERLKARKRALTCRRGRVKRQVRGKRRCVRRKVHHRRAKRAKGSNS